MRNLVKILFLVVCFFVLNESQGQSIDTEIQLYDCDTPWEKRKKIDIQEVAISDSILITEIKKLIAEESDQNEMFKGGLGYIYVNPDYDLEENVVRSYYINVDYTALKAVKSYPKAYLAYPNFYSFVAGRLVFIKLQMLDGMVCFRFSEKSMKNLRKIQSRFLEKEKRTDVFNMEGQKVFTDKHFRIDYSKLHGGKFIYIYSDRPYEVKNDPLR